MRKFETPYVADWLAVSLRWVVLVGLLVSLALRNKVDAVALTLILLMAGWNIAMSVLAGLNLRIRFHRQIVLSVDFLLAALFFFLQGGLGNASAWTGLYPLLTGAVYFELLGSLVVGALFIAWQLIVSRVSLSNGFTFSISSALTLSVLFTLVCGVVGRMLMRRLRTLRRTRLDAEERRRNMESERLRAIYELTSTLTATLSYKRVLDSALDLGYTALNPNPDPDEPNETDERLVSAVYLFRGNELRVGSARRYTNADMRANLHGNEGILKKIFDDGEPVLSTDIGYDPELGRIVALRSCTSAYCFPLRSGFNVYGAMLFAHPDPTYFTPERRGLLDIIGRQAVIAVQNARLYQDLVEEKERMIEVQEEARKKLARDLHDGPTQSVAAMAMRINLARRMMGRNVDEAVDELKKIEELALRTTKEIRHMLFTLRPLILESQGLTAALEAMAEKMRETFQQNVIINVDEKMLEQMEMGKQGVIFYIIEEAANNARKHANAVHIWVRLRPFETNIALLEIEDDGLGFDVESVNRSYDKRGSLGMVNLRERTELVNGLLNIDSAPGKGTRIQVYIPLTEEAADRLHHAKR
jgi:signal transduction histidine kinase